MSDDTPTPVPGSDQFVDKWLAPTSTEPHEGHPTQPPTSDDSTILAIGELHRKTDALAEKVGKMHSKLNEIYDMLLAHHEEHRLMNANFGDHELRIQVLEAAHDQVPNGGA